MAISSVCVEFHPDTVWREVQALLRPQMTQLSFETWLSGLAVKTVDNQQVVLWVESAFARDWVQKHYAALLQEAFSAVLQASPALSYEIRPKTTPASIVYTLDEDGSSVAESLSNTCGEPVQKEVGSGAQQISEKLYPWTPRTCQSNLNPKYRFETFVVGQNNRFCHAASLAVAETPAEGYNPFFIYGASGLGKTHLMQAIGHFILTHQPDQRVAYITAERFTNELIQAIAKRDMRPFRDRYRKMDVLLIDDIQFLEGKERTQEEVFHTFNTLHEAGKQIVLSSDRSPKLLAGLEERLRSRFEWGLMADIQPPDIETRLAILQKKAELEQHAVPQDVLLYIAELFPNNVRELEGALNKVVAYAMLTKTPLTLVLAQSVLGMSLNPANLSLEAIIDTTARYYHLRASDLKGASRTKDVAHARQVATYMMRLLTEASFPKIGEVMGKRKHTTVLYAYEKVRELLPTHPVLAQQIREIEQRIKVSTNP